MYVVFPMFTYLEIFPFWAIKLYLFPDPGSKEGWIFRRRTASHRISDHIWKFAPDINLGKMKMTVILISECLRLAPPCPESFSCAVQCACIAKGVTAGIYSLDTWTTSKDLFSWILLESFSNTYKKRDSLTVPMKRSQKLGLQKHSNHIGNVSSRGKSRYPI